MATDNMAARQRSRIMRAPMRIVELDTEELMMAQTSFTALVMAGRITSSCGRIASTRTSNGIYFQRCEGCELPAPVRSLPMSDRERKPTSLPNKNFGQKTAVK